MEISWDNDICALLAELSAVQEELLALLSEKRKHLRTSDAAGLLSLQPREQSLIHRLQQCHDRRGALLQRAAAEGLPARDLTTLAEAIGGTTGNEIQQQLAQAAQRSRLLQHQSLSQWVFVQRTLLHLSQLLEIIATGGQGRPTYGKEDPAGATGALVDHAA